MALLVNPGNQDVHRNYVEQTQAAASALGVMIRPVEVRAAEELERAFSQVAQDRANGVIVPPDGMFYNERESIAALALQLPALAAELVRLEVDVIVTTTTVGAQAARVATRTIPIVLAVVNDPVAGGLVVSLARPGGNITGLSLVSPELGGKRLQLLKEVLPGLSRIAVLSYPTNLTLATQVRELEAAARALGVTLQILEVRSAGDFESAFEAAIRGRAGAILTLDDPLPYNSRTRIIELAAKSRLPSMSGFREFVDAGGLMSYGPSLPDLSRRAATYVDKILKGAKPGDLPIEQPTKFELVINLKTAKTLRLTIPQSLLLRADGVIE